MALDYETMRKVAYDVWDRFADDASTFEAFATTIIGAGPTASLEQFCDLVRRLKDLFRGQCEDVIAAVVAAQPLRERIAEMLSADDREIVDVPLPPPPPLPPSIRSPPATGLIVA